MRFQQIITGYPVEAEFSDAFVQTVALPLIHTLDCLQRQRGGRVVVFLAAPPAVGKSTMAAFLEKLSSDFHLHPITSAGMDGFHRYQEYLLSHTMERNGKQVPMVSLKGAPETFDLDALRDRLLRLKAEQVCPWPEYDRRLHNPRENARQIQGDIVLIEGNYLLLDWPGWRNLKELADYTVSIRTDPALLYDRLLNRKLMSVPDREAADRFVRESDLYNAETVLNHMLPADLSLEMTPDGDYRRIEP